MPRTALTRHIAVIVLGVSTLVLAACGGAQARKVKHLEKGQAFLAAGNFEKARVEFQNALQIASADPEARFENGVVDEKLGKARDAALFYQGTIDISPDHVGARIGLARFYLFAGVSDKTLEVIKPALEKHPDNAELLTLRAAAHVQKKELAEGQVDAERAVQLDPASENAVSALAGIYMSEKSPEKAQTLLEETIKKIPASVSLRMALAQVYAGENRVADTERVLIEIVGLQPKVRENRIRLAQFYAHSKQDDAAERALREGIKAIPQDRDLKLSLVDFLAAQRSPEVAEKELLADIAAQPDDVELKFALGKFYITNRKPELAEKVYQGIIDSEKLNAAGISARDRLAALRAHRNDIKGTEELVGQVLGGMSRIC